MPISISKSPNWVPGKGFTFSNQHGGAGGMSMGGGATPPAPVVVDNYTKMLLHFDDNITSSNGGTISSVQGPLAGILSKDGVKAYIGSSTSDGLRVINVNTNVVTKTIAVTGANFHLVMNSNGTKIYAANNGTGGVNVFDASTDTFTSKIATATTYPRSLAITPNDKFLFVSDEVYGLFRVDLSAATPTATLLGDISWGAYGAIVSPDGTKLLVSTGSDVKVYSLNQETGAIALSTTLTGFSAYWAVGTSTTAYYTDGTNSCITPISFSTLQKGTNITTGTGPRDPVVSPDGKYLYVSSTANTVTVIDTTSNKVINTLTGFTAPRGGAATNSKLFIANNTANTVSVVDVRTFADAAQSPLTQSRVGTSVLTSTTQSKFGGKSLALNGTNTDKLQFANPKGKAINFGSSNWTMEGWFWFNQKNIGYQPIIVSTNFDGSYPGPELYLESNSCLTIAWCAGTTTPGARSAINSSFNPNANIWYHIAVVRNGGTVTMYVDGTSVGSSAVSGSIYNPDYIGIGVFGHAQHIDHFNGYMDGIRIQVGEAAYTGNFTAPTSAPTANSYTKLLMNFDSTIRDESTSSLYSHAVGSTAVISSAQSKFGGSSLKMSGGTTDYVKIYNQSQPIALFDRPFTIEGWFWLNSNTAGFQPIITMGTSADYQGPIIIMQSNNTLNAYLTTNVSASDWNHYVSTSFTPSANAWHHIALVREYTSGPIKLYCDGVLRGSNSTTSSVFTAENVWAGHYPYFPGGARTLNGYVDEVRITLDYCAYNGNFTPAAAPFTDGKNLLMHFDGANNSTTMTDSSTYARVATASGGAVISTTKSKFGGSSLYLPGNNTNAVVMANSSDFAFGTGDFTVEAWINIAGMSAGLSGTYYNAIFDTGAGNQYGRLFFCLNSSRKLIAFNGSGVFFTGSTSLILDSWYHIAVARKGSLFFVYLNGSLEGSATVSFNLTESAMRIGSNFDAASVGGIGFNGYIDEFRVTKGTALYAGGDFTPPTTPFTLIG